MKTRGKFKIHKYRNQTSNFVSKTGDALIFSIRKPISTSKVNCSVKNSRNNFSVQLILRVKHFLETFLNDLSNLSNDTQRQKYRSVSYCEFLTFTNPATTIERSTMFKVTDPFKGESVRALIREKCGWKMKSKHTFGTIRGIDRRDWIASRKVYTRGCCEVATIRMLEH